MTTLLESRKHGPRLRLRLKDGGREWWEVIPRHNVIGLWPYIPAIGFRLETGQVRGVTASKAAAAQLARLVRGTDALWGIREWGKELPKGENTMPNIQPATATIPFHGSALRVKEEAGEIWVAVKPICEHLGVSWQGQSEKLASDARFSCQDILMTAADGKNYAMTALNQNELLGWLYTINPNKVKAAARPLLLAYQKETTQAINDYWTKGQAVRPSVAPAADPELVGRAALRAVLEELDNNAARFEQIERRLDETPVLGKRLGKVHELGQQLGKLVGFRRAWTLFNKRFGLASYRDLPNCEYEAALQFLRYQIISYGGHLPDRLL